MSARSLRVFAFLQGRLPPAATRVGRVAWVVEAVGGEHKLGALVGDVHDAAPRTLAEQALAHDAVVREALDSFDAVVPVRFGSVMDEGAIPPFLARHGQELAAEAGRLAGTLEFELRLGRARCEPALVAPSAVDAGRRHLERRLAREELDSLRLLAAPLRTRLEPLARAAFDATRVSERRVELSLCLLVERCRAEAFLAAAAGVESTGALVSTLVLGPWAPYSFVRLKLSELA